VHLTAALGIDMYVVVPVHKVCKYKNVWVNSHYVQKNISASSTQLRIPSVSALLVELQ